MLTDIKIKTLKPEEKAKKYADGGGLFLYIPPNGSKLWRMAYTYNSKAKLLSFGKYPIVSLKDAREKRDAAKKLLAEGIDPSRHKREQKLQAQADETNVFEYVVNEWLETQVVRNTEKDIKRKKYLLETYVFPTLRYKQISEITAMDILQIVKPLEKMDKICTAHKIIGCCGMVLRYAMATARITNIITPGLRGAIRAQQTKHRTTIIEPEKIGKLLHDFDNYQGHFQVKCALQLFPILIVRSAELTCAQWSEFNFDKHEWHIPAERMKMRLPHIVPLSTQAMDILSSLRAYTGNGPFLFPSRNSIKKPIHACTPLQALRGMGYSKDEMCIHGFRSMASTLLNERGYNRDWIERQLAHKEKDKSRIAYNHAQYLPQRHTMMQEWADMLDSFRQLATQPQ